MKPFTFDPAGYAADYVTKSHAHIKGGLTSDFLDFAQTQARTLMENEVDMKEWEFAGKKLQFLFEFPEGMNYEQDMLEPLAEVAGVDLERMLLCERHIKAYDAHAPSNPAPHKDRLASQITVGLPLVVPDNSYIIAYPDHHRDVNPFGSTAAYRSAADQGSDELLSGIEPIKLDVQPGDVIMFPGSSLFHERVNPAKTVLLYLKFNAMRMDPIGEDPRTPIRREQTLRKLADLPDEKLRKETVYVSPRLDRISRHYTRLHWKEVIQAFVWGEKEFGISEEDLQVFRHAESEATIEDIFDRLGLDESERRARMPALRRLIELNGLEILHN